MKRNKLDAIVVLSGGQDSALCLKLACDRYGADRVGAITFNYGQRHAIETQYAKRLVKFMGVKHHKIIKIDFYNQLTTNALLDPKKLIHKRKGASPTTVVEGRNAFFLLTAGIWAKSVGAKKVYTGVSQADYSGYPDCRAVFIKAQQKMMRLAMEWDFEIVTPFMKMSKAQEWALADRLGMLEYIREKTVTCYRGVPGDGCGTCPACQLRVRGLKDYLSQKAKKKAEK